MGHISPLKSNLTLMGIGQVVVVLVSGAPGGHLGDLGICTDITGEIGQEQYVILFENAHLVRLTHHEVEGTLRVTRWNVRTLLEMLSEAGVSPEDVGVTSIVQDFQQTGTDPI